MRSVPTLTACSVMLGGCSVVEQMAFDGQPTNDPAPIYLGPFDEVETTRFENDRYACANGAPLVCEIPGITMECSCPL